ncbi:RNA polymerase subunit sigma-70 [Amycolatopsis sp. H20-H5]|uniref:RNA polymerase subunit sigma-70 n=1 Tax=Amycolatopsis sp. H20-H5 TaxID=3046309 RepID=UPI002DBC1D4D|nr:RNA polymerase subunit sigma-70 [Amycolatopsis sp. H20-H5]MEC3980150.1 RNA polymerase subunit sigma-70 [Amycolatopsis sp. H20-H5]
MQSAEAEDKAVVEAARAGDEAAFAGLTERYRRELRVHCYRMLGSFDESEDLVQETLLRAWRGRETYQARATFRAWLYRIATNACLDFLDHTVRKPLPTELTPAASGYLAPLPAVAVPWLQPYPDKLLEPAAAHDQEPPALAVARETIELAFLAAIQYLPPRPRAALILRDVLGWSAKETALLLETTTASANSALQRARAQLKEHLPARRADWGPATDPSEEERVILQRYMTAVTSADDAAIGALLRDDVRCSHQPGAGGHDGPEPTWYSGLDTVLAGWEPALHGPHALAFRMLPTRANGHPAVATYIKWPSESGEFAAFTLNALLVVEGKIAEVVNFVPAVFESFGLPKTLPA